MNSSNRFRWAGLAIGLAASAAMAQALPPEVDMYSFNRSLGDSSLPVAFVFGDPARFCLPGDSACKAPAFPAGIAQPAAVVVTTTTIGTCPVEIRTGNIALQTWLKLTDRFVRGINTIGFSFPALRPYNPDSAYFSAMIDLVAVPLDAARCTGGLIAAGTRDLGYLSWGGNVGLVGYDGRSQIATPLNVRPATSRKLRMQWDSRAITLYIDDCRAPLFETPVYQARGTAPAALFPVVSPHVLLSPAVTAVPAPCTSTTMTISVLNAGIGRSA